MSGGTAARPIRKGKTKHKALNKAATPGGQPAGGEGRRRKIELMDGRERQGESEVLVQEWRPVLWE